MTYLLIIRHRAVFKKLFSDVSV